MRAGSSGRTVALPARPLNREYVSDHSGCVIVSYMIVFVVYAPVLDHEVPVRVPSVIRNSFFRKGRHREGASEGVLNSASNVNGIRL